MEQGDGDCGHKCDDNGHDVEALYAFLRMDVLVVDADSDVDDQEDQDGQKGCRAFFGLWFHGKIPLLINVGYMIA